MCDTCGCGTSETNFTLLMPENQKTKNINKLTVHLQAHNHNNANNHTHHDDHHHSHEHNHDIDHNHTHHDEHDHHHENPGIKTISIEKDILQKNNLLAQRNRGFFEARGIVTINMVSSPGSGKTTLLEKTITTLKDKHAIYIIEGDQQTTIDANRIKTSGAPVVQINTGSGCHLDAAMINKAVKDLNPVQNALLIIENVGNLVCPALFDLGENFRVLIVSVTEGEDKPLKYPQMFMSSQLCLINKIDLLPHLSFSVEKLRDYIHQVNHNLECIELSALTGEGFDRWINWVREKMADM
jgi:hydrogenase nickel incorporation protein HypB